MKDRLLSITGVVVMITFFVFLYLVGNGSIRPAVMKNHEAIKLFIDEEISEKNTTSLVRKVRTLNNSDTAIIHMFTPGGEAGIGLELLSALRASKADLTMIVDTYAASMGAILLCDWKHKLKLNDDAIILFHTIQVTIAPGMMIPMKSADISKANIVTQLVYYRVKNTINAGCRQAFTDQEWKDMWDEGKNIVMTGKEYKKRMGIKDDSRRDS